MVNITAAATAFAASYASTLNLGKNYSYPLPTLASQVSSYFLPNYTSFTLGAIKPLQNQSSIATNFIALYTLWRQEGQPGTMVDITKTRVERVSDESALCWLTYEICPTNGMEDWRWTNVYGYRMLGDGNGTEGWEFAVGDQEREEYAKRFPETTSS